MAASFERFDYQLRSNKHIERKLIFDLLMRAKKTVNFAAYRYLGLGSMWFADHRLAHRLLGIDDLVSIEHTEHADRAEFNKPYGSVRVLPGMSYEVLPEWKDADWAKPSVVWMDYDGNLDEHIADDLALFAQRLHVGSVILVSVNAYYGNYKIKQTAVDAAAKRGVTIDPRAVATLNTLLGDVVPAKYQNLTTSTGRPADVKEMDFSECMAAALLAFLSHKVTSSGREENGQRLRFVPLFNFCHKDGVEMVTVGGAITGAESVGNWEAALTEDPVLESEGVSPIHHRLDLIPITLREKLVLDSILPSGTDAFAAQLEEKGVRIGREQAEKYRRHYRHFPIFVESPI
ncbi:O-methyltransferase [Paraburkholderia nodosa]|uniref:O-methyltransferase n=1 Tax=Paraburkholderia nodosa TaxID=392320 RepID=UPI0008420B40|nr:O-methyltransferase [Paraburkholderia nodosa]